MKEICREYLAEQIGDESVSAQIYANYARLSAERLASAVRELDSGDWEALERTAHTMKGDGISVGDAETAIAAAELRDAAKRHDAASCSSLMNKLRTEISAL